MTYFLSPPNISEEIINKALEKDRNLRYQHAVDIRADLQRVKRDSDSGRTTRQLSVDEEILSPVPDSERIKTSSGSTAALPPVAESAKEKKNLARNWKFLLPATVLLAALLAGVLYWRSTRAHALTEKDTILLSDFINTTGDPVFDRTLRQALAVQLQQSPFLYIFPDKRVGETLQHMGRPSSERVIGEIGREITQSASNGWTVQLRWCRTRLWATSARFIQPIGNLYSPLGCSARASR